MGISIREAFGSRATAVSVCFIAVILVGAGCGDDGRPMGPLDSGPLGPDALVGPDGGPVTGDGGIPPVLEAGTSPLPMRDGGTSMGETGAYFDSEEEARRAECECSATDWGFASVADCIAVYELPAGDLRECHDRSFEAHSGILRPHYACVVGVNMTYAACLRASGCGSAAVSRCERESDDGHRACPEFGFDEERRYMDTLLLCTGGPASPCPEGESGLTGSSVFIGSTMRAGDDYQPSCAEFHAPDRAFRWTAPSSGTFVFETAGSGFNTVLYVLRGCGGEELACNDDWVDPRSQVEVTLSGGEMVIIVVDGYDEGSAGNFVVNVFRG